MNTFLNKCEPSVVEAGLLETTWWRAMKKLVLSVLITLSGCSLLPRAYYRGQPVELNPLYEEICTFSFAIGRRDTQLGISAIAFVQPHHCS